jgi:hypothetical protein
MLLVIVAAFAWLIFGVFRPSKKLRESAVASFLGSEAHTPDPPNL